MKNTLGTLLHMFRTLPFLKGFPITSQMHTISEMKKIMENMSHNSISEQETSAGLSGFPKRKGCQCTQVPEG